jgi:DNA polymerase III alpha subunit
MITLECGCEFQQDEQGRIIFDTDITKMNMSCPATWDLICEGNTKGVFQLESQLGRSLAKQAKPRNIEELSDLIAIMRPGCLEAIVKGKSLTMHYIDRKHKKDAVEYFHEALEPILKSTYGILVFQEQAILLAQEIAGFDLQEADILRKAIGKKKADVMAKVKKNFIDKSVERGIVTKAEAEEIFSWIEKISLIVCHMHITDISQHMQKRTSPMSSLLLISSTPSESQTLSSKFKSLSIMLRLWASMFCLLALLK